MPIRFGRKCRKISYLFLAAVAYATFILMMPRDVQDTLLMDRYVKLSELNTSVLGEEAGLPKISYVNRIFDEIPLIKKTPMPVKKYILVWTPYIIPLHITKPGQKSFIRNHCEHKNCYLIHSRKFFKNITKFDAVIFSGCALKNLKANQLPKYRSTSQKYIFATLESAAIYPVTNPIYDNFFNWTWTTRLTSDISWNYIAIYDLDGNKVGPSENMRWPLHLKPIGEKLISMLNGKRKAVAWIVSHCRTHSRREQYVASLDSELRKFNYTVDTFGACGNLTCDKSKVSCRDMLSKDYYFYLSFENSFDEDYVTEKLLTALHNNVVPIVYGGANYSRFLPPGSYFNAREHTPKQLAKLINDVINNSSKYHDFFRWRNHFKYKASENGSDVCNICTALNDPKMVNKTTTYNKFRLWWNGPVRQQVYEILLRNILSNSDLLNLAEKFNYTRENSKLLLEFIDKQSNETKDKIFKKHKEFFYAVSLMDSTENVQDILAELASFEKNLTSVHTFSFNFLTTEMTAFYNTSIEPFLDD